MPGAGEYARPDVVKAKCSYCRVLVASGLTATLVLFADAALAQAQSNTPGGASNPAPPAIVFSPQISVPTAAPPSVVVPVPKSDWSKWVTLGVSVISAFVGLGSVAIAYRAQTVGFQKDAAALVRDIKAKTANAVIQAFENNVARPIGMVLDQIERLTTDMTKITQVGKGDVGSEAKKYASQLAADNAILLRLCREADGGLADGRTPVFLGAYATVLLDGMLFEAGYESLSGSRPIGQSAAGKAMEAVGALKIKLRHLLEDERIALIAAQTGSVADDPYYPQLQKLLGKDFANPPVSTRPSFHGSLSKDLSDAR